MAATSETLNSAISDEDDDGIMEAHFPVNTRNQVIPSSMSLYDVL